MINNCRIDEAQPRELTLKIQPHPSDPNQLLIGLKADFGLLLEGSPVAEASFVEGWDNEIMMMAGQLVGKIRQKIEEALGTGAGLEPRPQEWPNRTG